MRYLVTGAGGQLGRALCAALGERLAWHGGRDGLDVRDGDAVRRLVAAERPEVVVNASAYNAVDAAEAQPEAAFAVNAAAVHHLAQACHGAGALLVHVSTDYVFDGALGRPYREDDVPRPLSVYGVSKLAGEMLAEATGGEWLLVRTSGVFGRGGSRAKGGSFVERMVARAAAGEPLAVVDDQVFSPTYAPDLAGAVVGLVERRARGRVHVTNSGQATWHELACAALEEAGLTVPISRRSAADLGAPATRPRYSVLDNARASSLGIPALRHWREALREMLGTP